jgi:hypothetical protein
MRDEAGAVIEDPSNRRYGEEKNMRLFRLFLAACFLSILAYTAVTIAHHGWNLVPVFFGDMRAMAWPGQFNYDFFTFLLLSGLWTAWRNDFSAAGLALAVVAIFGGMLFLSAYLLWLSYRVRNLGELVAGVAKAQDPASGGDGRIT